MDPCRSESSPSPSPGSGDGRRTGRRLSSLPHPPNYSSPLVQDVLEHLASIDLIDLCNEAKVEHCRATRDLSSCGRYVQHVLSSCGHASLCAECSQRFDICPICRTSIPNSGTRLRLRLYYKCIEAGLISKQHDDRFQEKEVSGEHVMTDIQRLFSLFDVALENNLVSLICHYVTDVCMDENAMSSDPVSAFLLDEVAVKEWCKQTFKNIICDLQEIYRLGVEAMKSNLCLLHKLALHLAGISNVLEVIASFFKDTIDAQLNDLHHLLENVLKAKQHLEVIIWCSRHQFLQDVQSRFPNYTAWVKDVYQRKKDSVERSWPELLVDLADSDRHQNNTLFIEEALSNLELEESYRQKKGKDVDISCLQDDSSPLLFWSKVDESSRSGCYPFKNLRIATDVLFLHGSSDMVVAKQAIFLYYLYDRHWTKPDAEWRYLIEDFASSFGITKCSVLECLVFYLLDDHSSQALQEASRLLPEIARPEAHPKIAQVLLERQHPDIALTFLQCSGQDGFCPYTNSETDCSQSVSLGEAITVIRVRIECGLLTEAFMYQRMYCSKQKEENLKLGVHRGVGKPDSYTRLVEALVIEICYLCIRRNLIDRMIELPWNADEEKSLHKCLFDYASKNPSSIYGSLLLVFYLQRHRYIEAYKVDRTLQKLEQSALVTMDEDVAARVSSISQWRAGLVDKCLDLLPEVEMEKVMTGNLAENDLFLSEDVQVPFESVVPTACPAASLFKSSSKDSSIILQMDNNSFPLKRTNFSAASPSRTTYLEFSGRGPSTVQHNRIGSPTIRMNTEATDGNFPSPPLNEEKTFINGSSTGGMAWEADFKQTFQSFGDPLSLKFHLDSRSKHVKELNPSPSRVLQNEQQFQGEKSSFMMGRSDSVSHTDNLQSLLPQATVVDNLYVKHASQTNGFLDGSLHDQVMIDSGNQRLPDGSWIISEEANVNPRRKHNSPFEEQILRSGARWTSGDSSEDEEDLGDHRFTSGAASVTTRRRARTSIR